MQLVQANGKKRRVIPVFRKGMGASDTPLVLGQYFGLLEEDYRTVAELADEIYRAVGGKHRAPAAESSAPEDLSAREQEVFDLIVRRGLNNTEIGEHLGITERSAKFLTTNVIRKMGTSDRLKLAVRYWQGGGSMKAANGGVRKKKRTGHPQRAKR